MPKKTPNSRRRNAIDDHPVSLGAHYLEEMSVNLGAARTYAAKDFTPKELEALHQMGRVLKQLHDRQQKRNA